MRALAAFFVLILSLFAFEQAAKAAVSIRIDLSSQSMQVTSGNGQSYSWPISSARSGFVTPRGSYRAQRLEAMHYSRKYHMSPMPHSIFFRGGYAIHGTGSIGQLGRPASHGCVRLSPGHAAQLYAMVKQQGASIQITGSPPGATRFAKAGHKRNHTLYASGGHKKRTHLAMHKRGTHLAMHNHRGTTALGYAAPSPRRGPAPVKTWQSNPATWFSR